MKETANNNGNFITEKLDFHICMQLSLLGSQLNKINNSVANEEKTVIQSTEMDSVYKILNILCLLSKSNKLIKSIFQPANL